MDPIITRRAFLGGSAGLSLMAVMGASAGAKERLADAAERLGAALAANAGGEIVETRSYSFSVERVTDLVQLDVNLHDFIPTPKIGALRSLAPGPGSFISVQFPPQAIGEAAYGYSTGDWYVDPPPVLSVLAGPSRLCFTTSDPIEFSSPMSVTDLLDWSNWTLLVPAVKAGPPAADATFIEYPYAALSLSGARAARGGEGIAPRHHRAAQTFSTFAGRTRPLVSSLDATDCWTAEFRQTALGEEKGRQPSMAAVWARGEGGGDVVPPNDSDVLQIQYVKPPMTSKARSSRAGSAQANRPKSQSAKAAKVPAERLL